ncbi:unnamed protein product [Protopolystoma xenopodis]|uniref:Uncharacterized protein n=1 Tax=Protopolystoma xenopodis TaxID=117903 RepID=A0A3S5FG46_9PLAT|nr:unnamed protein product [Protopolystoma xenopodis]
MQVLRGLETCTQLVTALLLGSCHIAIVAFRHEQVFNLSDVINRAPYLFGRPNALCAIDYRHREKEAILVSDKNHTREELGFSVPILLPCVVFYIWSQQFYQLLVLIPLQREPLQRKFRSSG